MGANIILMTKKRGRTVFGVRIGLRQHVSVIQRRLSETSLTARPSTVVDGKQYLRAPTDQYSLATTNILWKGYSLAGLRLLVFGFPSSWAWSCEVIEPSRWGDACGSAISKCFRDHELALSSCSLLVCVWIMCFVWEAFDGVVTILCCRRSRSIQSLGV